MLVRETYISILKKKKNPTNKDPFTPSDDESEIDIKSITITEKNARSLAFLLGVNRPHVSVSTERMRMRWYSHLLELSASHWLSGY